MAFDPDKYLEEKMGGGGFDPDKYLSEKTRSPSAEESSEPVSQSRAALLGGGSGLFGFGDEGAGAMAALMSLFDPNNKSSMGEVYEGVRDITREEQKAAEEQHPGTYLAGGLASGVLTAGGLAKAGIGAGVKGTSLAGGKITNAAGDVTGKLAGILNRPLSALGKAAPAVEGPLLKPSAMKNIFNAAKVGMGSGAVTGLGMNESDLTTGEGLGQAAKEMAGTAAMGGVLGAGLVGGVEGAKAVGRGVKSLGANIADTKTAQTFLKAFGYGKQGDKVVGQAASDAIQESALNAAKTLGLTAEQLKGDAGKAIQAKLANLKANNTKVDLTTFFDDIYDDLAKEGRSNLPEVKKDLDRIRSLLQETSEGKMLDVPTIEAGGTRTTSGKPSARETMQEKINKILEGERLTGGSGKPYDIIESSDGKLLTGVRAIDEPVGASERVIRTAGEISPDEKPLTKVKRSFPNSPKDKAKAQEAVAKLNAKAKIEGKELTYELIDDKDQGFFHVIEKSPPEAPMVNKLDPGNNAENYSSKMQTVGPIENTPAVPPTTEQLAQVEALQQVRAGGGTNVDVDAANTLRKDLDSLKYGNNSSTLQSDQGINASGRAANKLRGILGDFVGEENAQFEGAKRGMDTLGLDTSGGNSFMNKATGKRELNPDVVAKLTRMIKSTEAGNQANSVTAGETMRAALEQMSQANPAKAKGLEDMVKSASEKLDLSSRASKVGFLNKFGTVDAMSIQAGNRLGLGVKSIKDITAKSPEWLKSIGEQMAAAGGKGAAVGKVFIEAANKDNVGRNALMFSLEQDKNNREFLRETFGWDDDNLQNKK